jgi:hypothetical protein
MVRDVIQVGPAETIAAAAKLISRSAVGCWMITLADAVKAIITDMAALGMAQSGKLAALEFSTAVARAQSAQHKARADEQRCVLETLVGLKPRDANEQRLALDAAGVAGAAQPC